MAIAKILALGAAALFGTLSAPPADAGTVLEGYLPSHRGLEASLAAIGVRPYTDVALSFINPDATGRFVNGDTLACMTDRMLTPLTDRTLRNAIAMVHAAHARAIGALAGAIPPKCAGDWAQFVAPPKRAATVAALVALADADGLDVDIEGDQLARLIKSGDYTLFVHDLSRALHAHHKTLYGTTASYVDGMIPLSALPAFDRVEVMAYDDIVPGDEHATLSQFRSDLYFWLGRGVARDKLVMGLPFYGHGYGSYAASYSYRDIVTAFGPPSGDLIGPLCATCSYVTLNGPATLAQKAALAAAKAGGVMVWEMSEDTPDAVLLHAVESGMKASPPASPAPNASTAPIGQVLPMSDIRDWTIFGTKTYALVPQGGARGNALELTVAKPTENTWDVGVSAPIKGAIKAGDRVTFAVRARLKAADPGTQLDVPAIIEGISAPNAEIVEGILPVTTQWQWLKISGVVTAAHAAGTLDIALQIGGAAKVIDLGPTVVVDQGPAS
jgi:hypothetical protein